MICFLCDKKIEGENVTFTLHEGFVLYQRDKPGTPHREIAHNCKTPRYYERRRQSLRASKLDKALRKAILNPKNKRARAALDEHIYQMLLSVATKGSTMDSVKASQQLIELFASDEAEPGPAQVQAPMSPIDVVIRERPLLASRQAGGKLADDDDDGTRQAQAAIQQSFEAQQQSENRQQPNSKGNGKVQQVEGVEDYEAVEERRERERQSYWAAEIAHWEKKPTRKFMW